MLSVAICFSLPGHMVHYQWGAGIMNDSRDPSSSTGRSLTVDAPRVLRRDTLASKSRHTPRKIQQGVSPRASVQLDRSFTSLSPATQELQRLIRDSRAGILKPSVADKDKDAWVDDQDADATRNDIESLRVLDAAHARLAAQRRGTAGVLAGMDDEDQEAWTVVSSDSSDFCRVLCLHDTPAARPPKTSTGGKFSRTFGELRDSVHYHQQKGMRSAISLEPPIASSNPASDTLSQPHDDLADPFGSRIVSGGEEQQSQLSTALREYRDQQADHLYKLFDSVAIKDKANTMTHAEDSALGEHPSSSDKESGHASDMLDVPDEVVSGLAGWEQSDRIQRSQDSSSEFEKSVITRARSDARGSMQAVTSQDDEGSSGAAEISGMGMTTEASGDEEEEWVWLRV
ncbi:hypothetical protein LTR53_005090 [Teratosphaeriaceae sp. CCFEE 6253]|nr:hypothetical protein LTR53_005090 [Teratosphaeriaceae sp. CCFEE 6253]